MKTIEVKGIYMDLLFFLLWNVLCISSEDSGGFEFEKTEVIQTCTILLAFFSMSDLTC